jgi:hypothetical protein
VTSQAEFDAAATDPTVTEIEVRGSATVRAYDSATVWAYDSATVRAYGSATVWAYDSATVWAYGSATVRAYDSATVWAGSHVAVHLHSTHASISGGVVIDHVAPNLDDAPAWAAYHAVEIIDGNAILFKAVSPALTAGEMYEAVTSYAIGATVTAPDWRDDRECGGGLHISPAPHMAAAYRHGGGMRFLKVSTPLSGIRPIDDKCKVRTLTVLGEVDIDGRDIR